MMVVSWDKVVVRARIRTPQMMMTSLRYKRSSGRRSRRSSNISRISDGGGVLGLRRVELGVVAGHWVCRHLGGSWQRSPLWGIRLGG